MHIVSADDLKVMPWKNGSGITREVMLCGDPLHFDWRVSIATVDQSSIFSPFPGIDRTIAVLQGAGLCLNIDGDVVDLVQADKPLSFAGEAMVHADCIDGETSDLNVMTRRAGFAHEMTRLRIAEPFAYSGRTGHTILIFNGACDVTIDTTTRSLSPLDAVCDIGELDCLEIVPLETLDVFQITVWEVSKK